MFKPLSTFYNIENTTICRSAILEKRLTQNLHRNSFFYKIVAYRINLCKIMVDEATKKTLCAIPLLKTKAGPRDRDLWVTRLKEEYQCLIKYVENNKQNDNDWFRLESNKDGTRWFGKCWYVHEFLRYEFGVEFDIPVTYPTTAPEIAIPELDGKTAKMYRGGKICLSDHFKPLWARNVPKFGIAHAMALGLGPWLAVEVPDLLAKGFIKHNNSTTYDEKGDGHEQGGSL
ncbi:ubiquitin-fold modifier-conjugating enzyme 1-like [Tropilaelaps mercedesae]|uniref:Ubiquitin-fold modifier-conjugating enzyme 1 n=1 Tax=Tropilaelaps mercedesae TaxID=418985 RepID=A0A1V9Y2I1_9ACAR|nr:ubiquitin-fold modifier-conjugating enzyme 1-like [Tropilaelaps mercedesae]